MAYHSLTVDRADIIFVMITMIYPGRVLTLNTFTVNHGSSLSKETALWARCRPCSNTADSDQQGRMKTL